MALEIMAARTPQGALMPLTEYDNEVQSSLKVGKAYKVEIKQQSARSVQHHRLFFGGLLSFAFQYWQPSGGMVTQGEQQILAEFSKELDDMVGNNDDGFGRLAREFLKRKGLKRAEKYGQPAKSIKAFRKWLITEAGYFVIVETPSGIRKEPMSISFANMSQEKFNALYKDCADVVWNVLLRHQFANEDEMLAAINEFLEMN